MRSLIFGATGSIGNYIFESLKKEGHNVIGTTSSMEKIKENIIYVNNDNLESINMIENIDTIVWAHGYNFSDNILTFNTNNFDNIIDANIKFILKTLNYLLVNNKINDNGKLVIISSIWEEFTRENKLSYTISKSALSGMVKNLAYDLSSKNILINNVLPGVIDNEMSRKALSETQINNVKNQMKFGRLITLDDVFKTIRFLITDNNSITGQSIKVDLGFTNLKKI